MSDAAGRLDASIRALNAALLELSNLLREERELLSSANIAGYTEFLPQKRRALEAVHAAEQLRGASVREAGHDPAPAAMGDALTRLGATAELHERWDRTLTLIGDVAQQNLSNGALLTLRRQFAADTLAILSGQSTAPVDYDRRGRFEPVDLSARAPVVA